MDFVINGSRLSLTAEDVEQRLSGVRPDGIQTHAVQVGGTLYPVKQVFALSTGLTRDEFTSQMAARILAKLGFAPTGTSASGAARTAVSTTPSAASVGKAWPWEGAVQDTFARWLAARGWEITATADTASKARGVDLIAVRGDRCLGAEVKGWPSTSYADPRRSQQVKPTQPSTQGGHWFAQALMKAIMLRDSHPAHESLIVLPDYPRYRNLSARTSSGRAAAKVHVVLVREDGSAQSDTWTA